MSILLQPSCFSRTGSFFPWASGGLERFGPLDMEVKNTAPFFSQHRPFIRGFFGGVFEGRPLDFGRFQTLSPFSQATKIASASASALRHGGSASASASAVAGHPFRSGSGSPRPPRKCSRMSGCSRLSEVGSSSQGSSGEDVFLVVCLFLPPTQGSHFFLGTPCSH